jgi:RND family efflux transporter MFP subunit
MREGVVVAVLVPLALAACGRTQGAGGPAGGKGGRPPVRVRVAPVAVQDVVYEVKALGSLEAEELVQVTAEVEGAVSDVGFHEGDAVTSKTVLLRIDPERYRLELERAEATLQKAVADQRRAEADLERREQLAREHLVAVEELNRSRGENDRLAAESAAAKAARDWARENLARAAVRAKAAGVINTRSVDTGQFVKSGAVLAILVDTSRLRLRFKVSEAESLRARAAETVHFRVAAIGDKDFTARVYHVGEVADASTRQVEVLAWVKNPGNLKPGFFAEVTLATETHQGALVVPEGAIQASERGFLAYAVADGKAQARSVQIGLRTGSGGVEIVSGLKAGETVVIEGSDRLADGSPVQPADSTGPAATPSARNAP